MSIRVTYWTGIWDPRREALSRELAAIRRKLQSDSPVVSLSAGQRTRFFPRGGVWRLSGRRWLLFRLLAARIERTGDVSHAYGGLGDWHLLRSLGRRPLLFTAALPGTPLADTLYRKVGLFAVQSDVLSEPLRRSGVPAERIRLVPPGLDLARFRPEGTPRGSRFRILFASSPAHPGELAARGIPLLAEVARRERGVEVRVLLREWGDPRAIREAIRALDPPDNFVVEEGDRSAMSEAYRDAHAVACCYAPSFGKSVPGSVIEGLACGRPALVCKSCGIAGTIARAEAGAVGARTIEGMLAALEDLRGRYDRLAANARRLAEAEFDEERTHARYAGLYEELAARSREIRR